MKSCPSHCETAATRQSPRKLHRERIRKGRAPAGFASKPQKSRNVAFGTPKNNEIVAHKNNENVPQPLRNVSHQAKPKKAASGAHPKRQSPSRFCVQAIAGVQPQKSRNVAFGTPKNNEIVPQPLRKGRAPAGFASKPLRNCNLKNLETLLLEPLKTMKSCPSHCETAATRQSPRKLRRERIRKGRAPAGFASKPLQECSLKNLETLLLEPLKTMKSSPIKQPAQNNKLRYKNTSRTKHRIRAKSCETARNTLLGALPLSKGSADFNHKQRPRTMPKCCLRNALRSKSSATTS